jgi:hypothetical protein
MKEEGSNEDYTRTWAIYHREETEMCKKKKQDGEDEVKNVKI